jgi:two-component system, OmpR family, sensor histidine kinase KdpD
VSPDASHQGPATCGRLRIYLGYAPGVGTTCALLREGRRRVEHGTDVVVAHAETHGRPHTAGLLEGLEVIPAATVPYGGTTVHEMDLRAVLVRRPQVAL